MVLKSGLRGTVTEVVEENLGGRISKKDRTDLVEAVVDRICVDHEVLDDEDEGVEDEEEEGE